MGATCRRALGALGQPLRVRGRAQVPSAGPGAPSQRSGVGGPRGPAFCVYWALQRSEGPPPLPPVGLPREPGKGGILLGRAWLGAGSTARDRVRPRTRGWYAGRRALWGRRWEARCLCLRRALGHLTDCRRGRARGCGADRPALAAVPRHVRGVGPAAGEGVTASCAGNLRCGGVRRTSAVEVFVAIDCLGSVVGQNVYSFDSESLGVSSSGSLDPECTLRAGGRTTQIELRQCHRDAGGRGGRGVSLGGGSCPCRVVGELQLYGATPSRRVRGPEKKTGFRVLTSEASGRVGDEGSPGGQGLRSASRDVLTRSRGIRGRSGRRVSVVAGSGGALGRNPGGVTEDFFSCGFRSDPHLEG